MAKILIIDDEVKICEFIEAYLVKNEHEVIISNSGSKALEIFENDKIDLIILDRMIPDISGEEICTYIRKKSNIPIIIVTAKKEG